MVRSESSVDDLILERQTADDVVPAYEILSSRTAELIEKKTGQYVAPYPPLSHYALRSERGQNWVARRRDAPERSIVGIVSLIPNGGADDWDPLAFPGKYLWISSLFVSPDCKGRSLGRAILERVKARARADSYASLWLDCYLDSGFLEDYYSRNGFRTVQTKIFTYGSRSFHAALMCHFLAPQAR